MSSHPILRLDARNPRTRGRRRGELLSADLPAAFDVYLRLFRTVGVSEQTVRGDAERITDIVNAWDSRFVEEIEGIAVGAGLETWQVAALNARTEILSQALGTRPGECSTLAHTPSAGAPFGIQTWDWHVEMDPFWHLQDVRGPRYGHVGLTEHGILGKIGMNSAGLGVFFNILGHRDDAPAGVPMHVLAAAVLGNTGSVEEAIDLVRSAPIASSGALTLVDPNTGVCAELSPAGVAVLAPRGGYLPHTNHFLDTGNEPFEKPGLYDPDSQQRLALIESRLTEYPAPTQADQLAELLCSQPGQPQLCCVPAPDAPFGRRWATLATILLEPHLRRARVLAGTPLQARDGHWETLVAAPTAG